MELNDALATARDNRESVLTTIRRNGRPQLSNVLHAVGDDGLIRISTTADRAKFKNLEREPWASLHVNAGNHWSYAVIEGDVTLSAVASEPDRRCRRGAGRALPVAGRRARRLGRLPGRDGLGAACRRTDLAHARLRGAAAVLTRGPQRLVALRYCLPASGMKIAMITTDQMRV